MECEKYTVVLWNWIDYGSLNRYVCLYLAGMRRHCKAHNLLFDMLLFMSLIRGAPTGTPSHLVVICHHLYYSRIQYIIAAD